MNKIKFISALLSCLLLVACVNKSGTIGDGKVDPIEKAEISLAVGLAFKAHPSAILPTYGVSTALLAVMKDSNKLVTLAFIEEAFNAEVNRLNLDPIDKQSFNDLVVLVKAEIMKNINIPDISDTSKVVVIRDIVQIVHDSAEVRLNLKLNQK